MEVKTSVGRQQSLHEKGFMETLLATHCSFHFDKNRGNEIHCLNNNNNKTESVEERQVHVNYASDPIYFTFR